MGPVPVRHCLFRRAPQSPAAVASRFNFGSEVELSSRAGYTISEVGRSIRRAEQQHGQMEEAPTVMIGAEGKDQLMDEAFWAKVQPGPPPLRH